MEEAGGRTSLLAVAVARYGDRTKDRPAVAQAVQRLVDLYRGASHVTADEGSVLIGDPTAARILDALGSWGTNGAAATGLLVWSGHCESAVTGHTKLLTGGVGSSAWIGAETLSDQLSELGFERWVVVIDSCWAYQVAATLAQRLNQVVGRLPGGRFVVLSSVDALDETEAGVFTSALVAVLEAGPVEKWWTVRDRFLDFDKVLRHLDEYLKEHHPTVGEPKQTTGGGRPGECIPNPLYRETAPILEGLDEDHFLPKAQGIEAGETGWFFTGRLRSLSALTKWLHRPEGGMMVVTGSAGTGKSAVLGRIITLSVPQYREAARDAGALDAPPETIPDEGAVQVAFHARERTVADLLGFLGAQLGVPAAREPGDLYRPLADRAAQRQEGFVIVIDALDEAQGGHARRMVDEVLVPIASRAGVKVLIGTRPGVANWPDLRLYPDDVLDLDDEPDTDRDIAAYATKRLERLPHSPYHHLPDLAEAVGVAVAQASLTDRISTGGPAPTGSFLVARVITKTLAASPLLDTTRPGWQDLLPRGLEAAFEEDLAAYGRRHDAATERLLRDLLEALAWDEGQGVPRRLVTAMARAVVGRSYTDDDVTTLLRLAGGHVSETDIDGWASYRLYHERFREHLRAVTLTRVKAGQTGG